MLRSLIPLAALVVTVSPAPARAERMTQAQFIEQVLVQAGLPPIAHEEALGHDVRHILLTSPYGMFDLPGIAIEERRDGVVMLSVHYPEWQEAPVEVPSSDWAALLALEDELFAPLPPPPPRDPDAPMPPPPPPCHAWAAWIAGSGGRTASWSACGGRRRVGEEYANAVASMVLATRPTCDTTGSDLLSALVTCLRPVRFDDPAIEERFLVLQAENAGFRNGSIPLRDARQALRAEGLAPGTPHWQTAREAIEVLRQRQDARREVFVRLGQLSSRYNLEYASPADLARLSAWRRAWEQDWQSQQENYVRLVEDLARAAE